MARKEKGYWDNFENCQNEVHKYENIKELKKHSSGCYYGIIRNKWKSVFFPNLKDGSHKWTNKDQCIKRAKEFENFSTFMRQSYDCYLLMKEKGWLDEVFKDKQSHKPKDFWNSFQNCQNEALKYNTITQLKRGNKSCYTSIISNEWDKILFPNKKLLDQKPFAYWNDKNNCLNEAKKYKTITELKKYSYGCYSSLRKHHWENDAYSYFVKRKPNGYWDIKENCLQEAKKYRNMREFQMKCYGAYHRCKVNNWDEEIKQLYDNTILYHGYEEKIHCVYVYEIKETHSCYIGRTNNVIRRHQQHLRDVNDTLNKYCKGIGIKIPMYKIIKDELDAPQSQEQEDEYIKQYKENGWNVLNKATTGIGKGSLGATCKWNYDACKEESNKYKTITEFQKANQSAYNACKKNGWTYDLFKNHKLSNGYWNDKANCKNAVEQCFSVRELIRKFGGCYNAIKKNSFDDLLKYFKKL